jgi:hypothetical protein
LQRFGTHGVGIILCLDIFQPAGEEEHGLARVATAQ